MTILADLLNWCVAERHKLGGVDGYDYKSGEEFGIRRVELQIEKRVQELKGQDLLPDGRDRLVQQNSLLISQIANCNKEIKRLREALLKYGRGSEQ